MRRNFLFITMALILIVVGNVVALNHDYQHIPVTRWINPDHELAGYQDYLQQNPLRPFEYHFVGSWSGVADDPLPFVIIVNTALYPQITPAVTQYIADLTEENYEAILYTSQGGTPAELKTAILQPEWQQGAVGVILIGTLPVPWFELYEDFDNDGLPDNPSMVNFPFDLYYMDLNGEFRDDDGDNIYDFHGGNWEPDIWVGRLTASTVQGGEAALINANLARNHAYRHGNLWLPNRALSYIDDDWQPWAGEWSNAVRQVWRSTTEVSDPNTTTAIDYMAHWSDNYQNVLLASHSAPTFHQLKQDNGQGWGYVYYNQIAAGDPHFIFYNLFACSNCRYTENNYCGGVYLFNEPYAVNVIGSTKTGSMLSFEDYYGPLGSGQTFGEAFNHWMTLHGNEPGSVMWARSWFYGMTNLGDPTLISGLSPAPINAMLAPTNPPITIPANGGAFIYTMQLRNLDTVTHQTIAWCDITKPDTSVYGPVVGPRTLNVASGITITRSRSMTIPASWAPGVYYLNIYAVVDQETAHDSFTFVKLTTGIGASVSQPISAGEEFGEMEVDISSQAQHAVPLPQAITLIGNYPNPFNPTTIICYQLSAASFVNLSVYNVSGKKVAELVNGMHETGTHQVTFDGSGLASGLYLYRLTAGENTAMGKMMLMK
jgi:hypothetical protein